MVHKATNKEGYFNILDLERSCLRSTHGKRVSQMLVKVNGYFNKRKLDSSFDEEYENF